MEVIHSARIEAAAAHGHSIRMMLTEFSSRAQDDTMPLMQNAETINRLVAQGEFLLKAFHVEYEKDPAGHATEFLRGDLAGWRDTLHTLYHDCAEEIVDRVLAITCLTLPDTLVHSDP